MKVSIWHGSIGDADVDVLVNASNTLGRLGSGVSAAIRESCGPGFQEVIYAAVAARRPGGLVPGDVVVTHAHQHRRARFVAHAAIMDYREGADVVARPDLERARRACRALWHSLEALPARGLSVGMVAFGAGTGGLGLRDSVGVACSTLKFIQSGGESNVEEVVFVAYDLVEYMNTVAVVRQHFAIDEAALSDDVRAFIDRVDD